MRVIKRKEGKEREEADGEKVHLVDGIERGYRRLEKGLVSGLERKERIGWRGGRRRRKRWMKEGDKEKRIVNIKYT